MCVSEILCLCAQQPDISVSLVDLGETTSLLCFPRQPSCSLCLILSRLLLVFRLFIYFSVISFCFITFPFNSSYPFCVYFFLSQFFSLFMSPSLLSVLYFPPSSFSHSQAAINRSLVGCWSVRNGRSDGFSQLLQAFPGLPRCTALCGPGFQTWRQNIQDMNRVLNIWTALMWAWLILPSSPES